MEKSPVPVSLQCVPHSFWYLLPWQELDQTENWLRLPYMDGSNPHFTFHYQQSSKASLCPCRGRNIFYSATLFPRTRLHKTLAALSLFPWILFRWTSPLVLTFTAKTRHTPRLFANHPHSLRVPLGRCTFTEAASSYAPLPCETDSQVIVSPITEIWNWSMVPGLTVIFHTDLHKLYMRLTL